MNGEKKLKEKRSLKKSSTSSSQMGRRWFLRIRVNNVTKTTQKSSKSTWEWRVGETTLCYSGSLRILHGLCLSEPTWAFVFKGFKNKNSLMHHYVILLLKLLLLLDLLWLTFWIIQDLPVIKNPVQTTGTALRAGGQLQNLTLQYKWESWDGARQRNTGKQKWEKQRGAADPSPALLGAPARVCLLPSAGWDRLLAP